MRKSLRRLLALFLCFGLLVSLLAGCGDADSTVSSTADSSSASAAPPLAATPEPTPSPTPEPAPTPTPARDNTPQIYLCSAPGTVAYGNGTVTIDCSNSADGYFMVNYAGSNGKVRMLVDAPSGKQYQFALHGGWESFPFSAGAGTYQINIFENAGGNQYYLLYGTSVSAQVKDDFCTFLRPNQFVQFDENTGAIAIGAQLAEGAQTDLEVVDRVYNYVLDHLSYDYNKAAAASSGSVYDFLPDVDEVLASGAGICFDYAAVMAVMLRTQGIPTRMNVGWAGDIYHAWVSVYVDDIGWINGYLYFDGVNWRRMDPTFADNGNEEQWIIDFINTDGNYNPLLIY